MATEAATKATCWPWGQASGTVEPPHTVLCGPQGPGEEWVWGRVLGNGDPLSPALPQSVPWVPHGCLLCPGKPEEMGDTGVQGPCWWGWVLPAAPPLTPTSPQGPGPPGSLGHLGPLCQGVVLRTHIGDGRESGCRVLGPRGSDTLSPMATHPCPQQVIKKTRFPRWDEVLEFELAEGELREAMLSVELWDWDIVGKNDFLGRVRTLGTPPHSPPCVRVWVTTGMGTGICAPTSATFRAPTSAGLPQEGVPIGGGKRATAWGAGTCPHQSDLYPLRSSSPWTPSARSPPRAGSSSCPSPAAPGTAGERRQHQQLPRLYIFHELFKVFCFQLAKHKHFKKCRIFPSSMNIILFVPTWKCAVRQKARKISIEYY